MKIKQQLGIQKVCFLKTQMMLSKNNNPTPCYSYENFGTIIRLTAYSFHFQQRLTTKADPVEFYVQECAKRFLNSIFLFLNFNSKIRKMTSNVRHLNYVAHEVLFDSLHLLSP